MKTSIAWMLLLVSLAFNAFVMLGYSQARKNPAVSAQATDVVALVSDHLDLDANQTATFAQLQLEMDEDYLDYQGSQTDTQSRLLEELDQAAPNTDRIRDLLEESAELQRQWRASAADRFGTFVDALLPEQRQQLLTTMRSKDMRDRYHSRRLEKFDTDGDGKLNEQEQVEARAYFEKARRQHGRSGGGRSRGGRSRNPDRNGDGVVDEQERLDAQRRQQDWQSRMERSMRTEVARRFDLDQDGALNEDELAALLQWLWAPQAEPPDDAATGDGPASDPV